MPELPEVETVRRGLEKLIVGKKIISVEFDWPKSFPNSTNDVDKFLIGASITSIRRRAKVLMIDLDSNYSLVIHLKMTGQLVFVSNQQIQIQTKDGSPKTEEKNPQSSVSSSLSTEPKVRFGAGHPSDSLIGKLPDKSTRVIIDFGDSKLFFNDQRKFGWAKLLPTIEVPNIDFFKKVGPEPLSSNFTAKDFILRLKKRQKSAVKAVLLDQTIIAGVGNIYADESLFAAKIHPDTKIINISDTKLKDLFNELKKVLRLSIKLGGSTDKNYVDAEGKKGSYLKFAKVFRREKEPCPRCKTTIIKIRSAGRGTHICPSCQKLTTNF